MWRASAFLARRSLRAHRRVWAAVFAATTAAAALIGAFAFVVGSLLLAQPPVDRHAGADAVVAADQNVTYTAKPWGSEPQTATTYLPERVRLDRSAVAKAAAADGVAKAVADDSVPVALGGGSGGTGAGGASAVGRSWASAALTPYRLTDGHTPRTSTEVVVDGALAAAAGSKPGDRVTLQVDGLPADAAQAVRDAPGVKAATGVLRSSVVLARREFGDPMLDRFPVLGVTADQLPGTLDPHVTAGDPADLTGKGTVAVGKDRAADLDVGLGDTVKLRLGDGTQVRLRVVALYERTLGLGEFMLPREALAGHVSAPRDQQILIRSADGGSASASAVRRALSPYTGVQVRTATADDVRIAPPSSDQDNALVIIGVGVIGGFALLAVISTLSLITVGRRPEFRLLRMVGAGRRQVRRMLILETGLVAVAGLAVGTLVAAVPLVAFAVSTTGSVPYLPPVQYGVLALAVTVAAGAGAVWPGSSGGRFVLKRRM
ncbi:ABC transporter permease [Streptomyces sp. NPDC002785]|uniref:ABC transporter permease n=1 Tax=Streptomyces sp. NPDC002785 TaxID=3154543 RepID=UPI00331FCB33